MNKLAVIVSASALALASSVAFAAPNAPAGFGEQQAHPSNPVGFAAPGSTVTSVQDVIQNSYDDQYVSLTGKLTNYLGYDKYEFADSTGKIAVELDDDRNWSHIGKDQLITIYAKVDRDRNSVELDVKEATPAK